MANVNEIKTKYGILSVPDADRDVVGHHLREFGEWASLEVEFIAGAMTKRDIRVLDGGAFLGTFGLGLERHASVASICFVEGNSAVTPLLRKNVEANCRSSWSIRETILASSQARIAPHREADNLGATSFLADDDQQSADSSLPRATLREIAEVDGPFDLIKLDVEQLEYDILKADEDYLSTDGCAIWVECNETHWSLKVAALLSSMNRHLYYFAFPAYNPDNFRGNPTAIFPWAYEAGLLAIREELPPLGESFAKRGCILRRISSVAELKGALWRTPRWGFPEWMNASAPEIVAIAGRKLRDENFDAFLNEGVNPGPLVFDLLDHARQALTAEREALIRANAKLAALDQLLRSRDDDLRKARLQLREAEGKLAHASALALDRLAALGAEREKNANRGVEPHENPNVSAIASLYANVDATRELRAITSSTYWRAGAPLRRIATRSPALRATLVALRRAAGKIARSMR